jgi:hypothetical protein
MNYLKKRTLSLSSKLILALLLLPSGQPIHAQSYEAKIKYQTEIEFGRGNRLHQHDAKTALLVSKVQNRFGIHSYDLANNTFNTLKVIGQTPLIDPYTPESRIKFKTAQNLTFIDIRGRLYSTDSTRNSTQFIRDFGLSYGGGSPGAVEFSNIDRMHNMGGKLLFTAKKAFDTNSDSEKNGLLLVSDGTRDGTKKLGPDFFAIGLMFNIGSDTFFFAKLNASDDPQIWQVSENGTRLSKIVETPSKYGLFPHSDRNMAIDNKSAYFCQDGQLVSFSKRSFTVTPVNCDNGGSGSSYFEKNDSGVFFNNGRELLKFDTDTSKAAIIYTPEIQFEYGDYEMCSDANTVIFKVDPIGRDGPQGRIISYNKQQGLQKLISSNYYDQIYSCTNDIALMSTPLTPSNDPSGPVLDGYSVYDFSKNKLIGISNLPGIIQFKSGVNGFGGKTDLIIFDSKLYELTSSRSLDNSKEIISLVEITHKERIRVNLAPIIDLLNE